MRTTIPTRLAVGALAAAAVALSACQSTDDQAAPASNSVTQPPGATGTVTESPRPTSTEGSQPGTTTASGTDSPAGTTYASPHANCSTESTEAIASATARIAGPLPTTNPDVPWVFGGATNYNTCNDLSYATLDTQGATASSPNQLLLFHRGVFVGTGVRCNLAYQRVTGASTKAVYVNYRYLRGDDASAAPSGSVDVSFEWNGSRVVLKGTLPAELTRGQC